MATFLPRETIDPVAGLLRAGPDHALFSTLEFIVVDEGDSAMIGEVAVDFAATTHPVPTVASRYAAGGRSLAYSADTGPGGGFPELAAAADVILCEATLVGERAPDSYEYHLSGVEAGALAAAAGADLIVTHVSPTVDPARVLAEAAAAYGSEPELAAPGLRIDI